MTGNENTFRSTSCVCVCVWGGMGAWASEWVDGWAARGRKGGEQSTIYLNLTIIIGENKKYIVSKVWK